MSRQIIQKSLLTYSALATFRSCPRKYKLRFEDHLKAQHRTDAKYFGQIIHKALTHWYRSEHNLEFVKQYIEYSFPGQDSESKRLRLLALAMIEGYADRYAKEDFQIIELDLEFSGPIRNPKTGCESRTFRMAGKANGIVRIGDELFLLEHRTASCAEELDPDKLWTDTQSALYCYYLRQSGYPIVGIIYNILLKSRLQQKEGESEEEYQIRYQELAAKNKSGKSTAQRQMPETDEEFSVRLHEWYRKSDAFQRVILRFPEERMLLLREEIWEITQQYLGSRRRGRWLLNTANCFRFDRPCEYLKYCQSGFNPDVCNALYKIALPHEELPVLGLNLRPAEQHRYEQVIAEREKKCAVC